MFIEKMDDFLSEKTSICSNGIMNFFSELFIFIVEEGYGSFNQVKAEKRLSAVKIEEIVFS
jgi:hypothetical protein